MIASFSTYNSSVLTGSVLLAAPSYPPADADTLPGLPPVDAFATTWPGSAMGPFTPLVRYQELREQAPGLNTDGGAGCITMLGMFLDIGACIYFANNGTSLSGSLIAGLGVIAVAAYVGGTGLGKLVELYFDHIHSDRDEHGHNFEQAEANLTGLYPEAERYIKIGPFAKESARDNYQSWRQQIVEGIQKLREIRQKDIMRGLKWLPPGWAIRFFLFFDNGRRTPGYKHELMQQVIDAHEYQLSRLPASLSEFYTAFRGEVKKPVA